jgi:hypothetical protein
MNRLLIVLPLFALLFLGFIAGAAVISFKVYPYEELRKAFLAAEALSTQRRKKESIADLLIGAKPVSPEDYASPAARDSAEGVTRHQPEKAYAGYTVYTSLRSHAPIPLIDMDGKVVHEWHIPAQELRGEREDGHTLPENPLSVTYPYLFPNGDMIMVLTMAWQTPWGFGIVKVDKDSNLIWKFLKRAHHSISVAPDGTIYALLHSIRSTPWPGLKNITTPFVEDTVVVLSPDGVELESVSVLKAIQDSPWQSLLMHANPANVRGDLLHVNAVTYIDAEAASRLPMAEAGQLLISMRNLDVIAILDLASAQITWAARGAWTMQHDPDLLDNGNLLIFDNRGDLQRNGGSRIIEVDPATLGIVWEYPGDSGERLYTSVYGSHQVLPNGNTLITESNNGRLLEVTREREIVWEHYVRERKTSASGKVIAQALWAERFAADELDFEFNTSLR